MKEADAGFSVLEALVAIAVLAMALMPILALQGQFVKSVTAIERAQSQLSFQHVITEHIRSLNMSVNSEGQFSTQGADITWNARPIIEPRRIRTKAGVNSRYRITLYDVEINVKYTSGGVDVFNIKTLHSEPLSPFLEGI